MLNVLNFVFADLSHFFGTIILIGVVFVIPLAMICDAIAARARRP